LIKIENVSLRYDEGRWALKEISAAIAPGERVVLLGANGSGKSSLLKLLNGLLFPQEGVYRYRDRVVEQRTFRDRTWGRRFRRAVVLLFQQPDAMLFNPTVYDEIAYGPRQLSLPDVDGLVKRWAAEFGLEGVLAEAPVRLSGGEKQKVCLAALLALEPELLLLDEPTANLDPRGSGRLIDLLQDLPLTTITATHNLSLAVELGTRALVLDEEHRLIHDGPLEALLTDRDTLLRANLVHRHRHRHEGVEHRHYHVHDWS